VTPADGAEFLEAMRPVARALGARIVSAKRMQPADIPLQWRGEVVAALRVPDLQGALDRMIGQVERELGGRLHELSREHKQRAVRLLDERGAFTLRKSIEDVADALGVSRITVYNYLNAVERSE
jgi:DNA binding protein with HTH domain